MRDEVYGRFAATSRACKPGDLRGVTMCQWFVRVQVAVAFGVMRAGLRVAAGTGTARYAGDKDFPISEAGLHQRYDREQSRRRETTGVPDMWRRDAVTVLRYSTSELA